MGAFITVPLDKVDRIQPDDYIRWNGLEGTVVDFVPHPNGYVYSLWLNNPNEEWMNDFEWIMGGYDSQPGIKKGRLEWQQTFSD